MKTKLYDWNWKKTMQTPSISGLSLPITAHRNPFSHFVPTRDLPARAQGIERALDVTDEKETGIPFGLGELVEQADLARSLALDASLTEFSLSGDGFALQGFSESFSFSAQVQEGNRLFEVNVDVTRTVVGIAFGPQAGQGGGDFFEQLLSRLPDDFRSTVEGFLSGGLGDLFSPEATANRISDFALGGFGSFDGGGPAAENSEASRQRFADFILPAIERGFNEALEILGELPDKVAGELQETRDFIDERFANFLSGGLDASA